MQANPEQPDIHTLALAYTLETGDKGERPELERHLTECDSCGPEAIRFGETARILHDNAYATPSSALRERIAAAARETGHTAAPKRAWAFPDWLRGWRGGFAVATAAVVAILLLFMDLTLPK